MRRSHTFEDEKRLDDCCRFMLCDMDGHAVKWIWGGTCSKGADRYDHVIQFPKERYPETGSHIQEAIRKGHSDVCTIDRNGADARRQESLKGIPTKPGFDRDEWPMAVCLEGGKGASVQYVSPSDNRGAGSWVGHQMSGYPDGKRILFIVK